MNNLIICPVGNPLSFDDRFNKNEHWRNSKISRNYEILVVKYGDYVPDVDTYDKLIEQKGYKWELAKRILPLLDITKYEYIGFFDDDIITDTDMLCQCNTFNVWNYMSNQDIPIRMLGRNDDEKWHWGCINEVSSAFGKKIPHVHGGFIYLRKSEFLSEFFEYCRKLFYLYDEYKCKRFFRGGKVDEIIFAISHSNFDLSPIEFDSAPIMTFNYPEDIDLPSKLQTENGQNIMMDHYIPFIHMFDKMEGTVFQILFDRLCKL